MMYYHRKIKKSSLGGLWEGWSKMGGFGLNPPKKYIDSNYNIDD